MEKFGSFHKKYLLFCDGYIYGHDVNNNPVSTTINHANLTSYNSDHDVFSNHAQYTLYDNNSCVEQISSNKISLADFLVDFSFFR